MSKLTLAEKIAVMQACLEGKTIQCRSNPDNIWSEILNPVWSWANTEYRIKPAEGLTIPWGAINDAYNWAAVDQDDKVYLYSSKPKKGFAGFQSRDDYTRIDHILVYKRGNVAWDESLIQRPK